ncbi:MAG: adenosylcobinamide-phosphate synthase CbiB [Thermochromatium sp.]
MTEHLILGACLLDALIGDPVYRLHPIRLIGHWILVCERALFALGLNGRFGGLIHWGLVVGVSLGGWFAIRVRLDAAQPWLAFGWDLFIAYSLLCTRELLEQGWRILRELDDLPAARRRLSLLVGRDTEPLQRDGVVRATLESLAENLTDGVLTPLWALCLFGLPGLIVVKAISTLDSMVGYKDARYARFGWAAARSDDLIHWLPARLSVPLLALAAWLLREHPGLVFSAARRYHALLPSPNSGWSEAACAGALRVRLLGPIWRQGRLVNQVYMGDPDWPADLDAADLRRGLWLILTACLLALTVGLGMSGLR